MIPTHTFGRTGHMSTRVIFGAAALSQVTQAEADQTMKLVIQHGINHIDVAASYGEAEVRLAPWLEPVSTSRQPNSSGFSARTGS